MTRPRFWLLAAILAVVAIALYAPTWSFDYTYLDDNNLILDQQSFLENTSSLWRVFGRNYFGDSHNTYYRPIVNLSLVINALWGGRRPFGYHLANGFLHAVTCVLVLALLRGLRIGNRASLLAACVFAAHPVHVMSVAWIPGRNDVLLSGFTLGSCLLLLKARQQAGLAPKLGHLLCFFGALLSKETALCLPLLFVFLLCAADGRSTLLRTRWTWPGWACAIGSYLVVRSAVIHTSVPIADSLNTMLQRWPVLLSDIGKLLLPVRLQVLAAPEDVHLLPGGVVIVVLAIFLGILRGMRRWVVVFALVCAFLPMLTSLLGARFVILENRLYLPVVGVVVLLGELLRSIEVRRSRYQWVASAAVVTVTLSFGAMTLRYSENFRDRNQFSQAAIEASPHSSIATNLRFRMFYHREIAEHGSTNP